ncbi:MAG: aspartyl/glutamyl-tRNA(Asn/Gln) amidotransferase subunit C [Candidatus Parcubacteria bacterium]|nr:MAG: aspartyl/glutamyl-tRNA(Asn/Gln) amidotransferase subunit C [Candidatus Parcubacteria bacterium]
MLNIENVKYLAKLARLDISDDEALELKNDLDKILKYVEKINELKLDSLDTLTNIIERLELREDKDLANISNDDYQDEVERIINNFPDKDNRYLKVPKVLIK